MVSGTRPQAVLAGLPNAVRVLCSIVLIGEQRAIVSDRPAERTRDYLSASVEWNGVLRT